MSDDRKYHIFISLHNDAYGKSKTFEAVITFHVATSALIISDTRIRRNPYVSFFMLNWTHKDVQFWNSRRKYVHTFKHASIILKI